MRKYSVRVPSSSPLNCIVACLVYTVVSSEVVREGCLGGKSRVSHPKLFDAKFRYLSKQYF